MNDNGFTLFGGMIRIQHGRSNSIASFRALSPSNDSNVGNMNPAPRLDGTTAMFHRPTWGGKVTQ
jgi:hypothetical protein